MFFVTAGALALRAAFLGRAWDLGTWHPGTPSRKTDAHVGPGGTHATGVLPVRLFTIAELQPKQRFLPGLP